MLRELRKSVVMWITLLMVVFSCEVAHANGHWNDVTVKKCLDDYRDWKAPWLVLFQVKRIMCEFLEDHPEYSFIRHSDWRALVEQPIHGEHNVSKSQHTYGKALDFRLDTYEGMDRYEILATYQEQSENFYFWLYLNGYECGGVGEYPQSHNPFIHFDIHGLLDNGKCGRRWGRIDGKYVSIDIARDWLSNNL